jgi:hypothetical protein
MDDLLGSIVDGVIELGKKVSSELAENVIDLGLEAVDIVCSIWTEQPSKSEDESQNSEE